MLMSPMKSALRSCLHKAGLDIVRYDAVELCEEPMNAASPVTPYHERPEAGPVNLSCKLDRVARGEPFEWPNIVALNQAVVGLLGDARRIVELGAGTGCFASHAAQDHRRLIIASDFDREAIGWAAHHRPMPNIRYTSEPVTPEQGPFDTVVSVEVIEHVADFPGFLNVCTGLAPRALLTTPNRARTPAADHAGPPMYEQHVREWTAGEFYWVLRCYYDHVTLYAMPDVYEPKVQPVDVTSTMTPLIADCRQPRRTPSEPGADV